MRQIWLGAGIVALGVALVLAGWTAPEKWWEEEETPLVQTSEGEQASGLTNWEDGYVESTGMGSVDLSKAVNIIQARALALDAARVRAYGQMAETVLGFHITSQITVRDGLVKDSEQKMRVEGFIKGARVLEENVEEAAEGSLLARVRVGILLARRHPGLKAEPPTALRPGAKPRALSQVILPTVSAAEAEQRAPRYRNRPVHPFYQGMEEPFVLPAEGDYSGLIVDARGSGGQPSMSPKIFTPGGEEVWGTLDVVPEYALSYGIAGWAHDLEVASASARAGENPLVVPAAPPGARGFTEEDPIKTYFLVDERQADFILAMDQRTHFLSTCDVVFVLD